ncbi:MAG: hypothetical protein OXB84_07100, partial [Halobacteriovoraceae bacterium]|nr:hypothetical protein [Halobacteriovoraceae bacterium]
MERKVVEDLFKNSVKNNKISEQIDKIQFLTGDASHRRYYRVFTKNSRFIVCLDNPLKNGELPFVSMQKVFIQNNIRVPCLYDTLSKEGYCLQEDLGDMTLIKKLALIDSNTDELSLYKKSIDLMIQIQNIP